MKTNIKTFTTPDFPAEDTWKAPVSVHVASRAIPRAGQTSIFVLVAPEGGTRMTCVNVPHDKKRLGFQNAIQAVLAEIPEDLHGTIRLKVALTKPVRRAFAGAMEGIEVTAPIDYLPHPPSGSAPSLGVLAKLQNKEELTDAIFQQVLEDLEHHFFPDSSNQEEPVIDDVTVEETPEVLADQEPDIPAPVSAARPDENMPDVTPPDPGRAGSRAQDVADGRQEKAGLLGGYPGAGLLVLGLACILFALALM